MSIQPSVEEVLVVVTTEQIDHHTAPDFREELAEGLRRWEAALAGFVRVDEVVTPAGHRYAA